MRDKIDDKVYFNDGETILKVSCYLKLILKFYINAMPKPLDLSKKTKKKPKKTQTGSGGRQI